MYTAVLIEPRQHGALKIVLKNFNRNLDDRWEFLIYHGINNKSFIENIISDNSFLNRKVRLVSLNVDNLTINDYNKVMFSDFYYDNIDSEVFLVFQIDTLLSDIYSKNIDLFLHYDYVGAPWRELNLVGNGGLSLRKKSKMIELLKNGGYKSENGGYHYEDRFFTNTCGNNSESQIVLNMPSVDLAKCFSVETFFYDKSVGFHKPWNYLNVEELNVLKTHFNDLDELMKMI
jgi:hypothetical protein